MLVSLVDIAMVYNSQKKYFESEIYSRLALKEAIDLGEYDTQKDILYNMYINYKDLHKDKLALETYEKYITIRDSIVNSQNRIKAIKQEYNLKKIQKEQQLILKNKQIELLENNKRIKNYILVGLIIFFILIAIIVALWFKNYNQRKKEIEKDSLHKINIYRKDIDILQEKINTLIAEQSISSPIIINKDINKYLNTAISDRELEILQELSLQKTNKQIADSLFISVNTVKTHLMNIYEKLEVNNRIQAMNKLNEFQD